MSRLEVFGIEGIGEIRPGDDLAGLIITAADAGAVERGDDNALADGDVVVVTQKIVSKAENQLVPIDPDDARLVAELGEEPISRSLEGGAGDDGGDRHHVGAAGPYGVADAGHGEQ
ncbi:MAG: coenzyme F420-0:L-glutamate ligase, partial [Acidimicrobiales bacterium]